MLTSQFSYNGTFCSALNLPVHDGLIEKGFDLEGELTRTGNNADVKITVTLMFTDLYNPSKTWEVFKAQSLYYIETDGEIAVEDGYELLKNSMINAIVSLNDAEKKNKTPISIDYHPIPFDNALPFLQVLVDNFYKK